MAERARHLVERVLPAGVPIRQVVLTLPWRLRLLLARRHDLCRGVLKVFLRAVFGWYRRRARRVLGVRGARCGAVTVIQRFGGALNLNVPQHKTTAFSPARRGLRPGRGPPPGALRAGASADDRGG